MDISFNGIESVRAVNVSYETDTMFGKLSPWTRFKALV